jgi:hypothetical protein
VFILGLIMVSGYESKGQVTYHNHWKYVRFENLLNADVLFSIKADKDDCSNSSCGTKIEVLQGMSSQYRSQIALINMFNFGPVPVTPGNWLLGGFTIAADDMNITQNPLVLGTGANDWELGFASWQYQGNSCNGSTTYTGTYIDVNFNTVSFTLAIGDPVYDPIYLGYVMPVVIY